MMKKGFVLVELLVVIIILSIILVIAVPTINNLIYRVGLSSFIADQQMIAGAAKNYLSTNDNYLPINIGDTIEIKLSLLQSEKLIGDIKSPWNDNDICDGYILITKVSATAYDYSPYLNCDANYKADGYMADGLATYWKLDGNAYDYTPNNNQGAIQNASAGPNRFGVSNTALNFNGPSNFIDTNYDYSLNYNGGTTFLMWVQFDTNNTDGKVKNIFGKNSWEYLLSQVDNKIKFTQWDSSGEYAIQLVSKTDIQVDKWYNIAVVYNGTEQIVYLYINGVIDVFSPTLQSTFVDRSESLKIGRGYPDIGAASSTFFVGSIDNLRIYNRALSSNEIKLYYDIDEIVNN